MSGEGKDPLYSTWVTPEGLRDQGADVQAEVPLTDWWFGAAAAVSPDVPDGVLVLRRIGRPVAGRGLVVRIAPPFLFVAPAASPDVPEGVLVIRRAGRTARRDVLVVRVAPPSRVGPRAPIGVRVAAPVPSPRGAKGLRFLSSFVSPPFGAGLGDAVEWLVRARRRARR